MNPASATPTASIAERLYPQQKRRYQSAQLMNFLLRPVVAPWIRAMAAIGMRGDWASLIGLLGYFGGAALFLVGTPSARLAGLVVFLCGGLFEFVDGGLARLRGPSPIGHALAKYLESSYIVLLSPCLAIGLARHDQCGLGLLLVAIFGASAHLQFRGAVEVMTTTHSAGSLSARLDRGIGRLGRLWIAQLLPEHESFGPFERWTRILRENLMESSGVAMPLLALCVLADVPQLFLWFYGLVHLGAWHALVAARLVMQARGGLLT